MSIESSAFRRWFGDSKVVDDKGKPLVVYHGTASTDIDKFDSWRGVAGHFAIKTEEANYYAEEGHSDAIYDGLDMDSFGAVVYPVYLQAKNIFDLRNPKHRRKVGIKEEGGSWETLEANIDRMKIAGFDSYYDFEFDSSESEITGIAVFRPEQIKSAIGNSGAFDPTSPYICDSCSKPEHRLVQGQLRTEVDEVFAL